MRGFHVSSGQDQLFIWADIVHVPHLQFAHPDWGIKVDTDKAAATRMRVFDWAATDLAGHGNALGLSGIRARNASQYCLFLHSHVLALRSLSRGPMRLTPVRGSFQVHLMSHTIAFGITFDARARTRRICAQFFLQGCFNKNVILKLCSKLAVSEKRSFGVFPMRSAWTMSGCNPYNLVILF
jgi:hypothetical protein